MADATADKDSGGGARKKGAATGGPKGRGTSRKAGPPSRKPAARKAGSASPDAPAAVPPAESVEPAEETAAAPAEAADKATPAKKPGGAGRKRSTTSKGSASRRTTRKPASPARKPAGKKPTEEAAATPPAEVTAVTTLTTAAAEKGATGPEMTETGAPAGDAGKGTAAEPAEAPPADAAGDTPVTAVTAAASGVAGALAPVKNVLASKRAPRLRGWIALVLVVMSVIAVVVSILAVWSRDLVFDTDTYVNTVAPVAEDPKVRHAVSVFVADKAIEVTRLETRIEDALPSDAKVLAAPLTDELRRFVVDEIDTFLGTEVARGIWVDLNRFTHEQLMAALEDRNRYVTIGQSDVKLDLLPLIAVALQKLEAQIPRLLGRDVTLPEIDPETAPAQIRTLLQDALGRRLPADFGSVTLLRGRQGYEAKQAVRLFKDLVTAIVILTLVLIAAALLVSPRRLRTALQLGLGVILAFVLTRIVEAEVLDAIVKAIKSEGGVAVATSIVTSALASLDGFFRWVVIAAVIVAIGAFLASRPAWLDAMGRAFSKLFGVASDLSVPGTRTGRWVAGHLDLLRGAGVVIAIVALLFAVGSLSAVLTVIVALIVYELALVVYGVSVHSEEGPKDTPV